MSQETNEAWNIHFSIRKSLTYLCVCAKWIILYKIVVIELLPLIFISRIWIPYSVSKPILLHWQSSPDAPNNSLVTAKKLRKLLYMWNYIMSMNYFHLEQMSCVLSSASTQTWKAWHLYIIINGLGFGTVQTFGLQTFRSTIITLSSSLLSRSKHFIKFSPHILPINILVILATIFRCAVNILGKLMDALSHFKQPLST